MFRLIRLLIVCAPAFYAGTKWQEYLHVNACANADGVMIGHVCKGISE